MARQPLSKAERDANAALGRRVAALRKDRGFTQSELADKLGVIQGAVSSYEVGRTRPAADMIVKLAEVLEVSTDQLLGRGPQEKGGRARDVDRRFLRRLQLVRGLPKRDQDALLRTIDAFLTARAR